MNWINEDYYYEKMREDLEDDRGYRWTEVGWFWFEECDTDLTAEYGDPKLWDEYDMMEIVEKYADLDADADEILRAKMDGNAIRYVYQV